MAKRGGDVLLAAKTKQNKQDSGHDKLSFSPADPKQQIEVSQINALLQIIAEQKETLKSSRPPHFLNSIPSKGQGIFQVKRSMFKVPDVHAFELDLFGSMIRIIYLQELNTALPVFVPEKQAEILSCIKKAVEDQSTKYGMTIRCLMDFDELWKSLPKDHTNTDLEQWSGPSIGAHEFMWKGGISFVTPDDFAKWRKWITLVSSFLSYCKELRD